MNRKCGFTLAEILVTLGIIGVVAALTAPALVNNTRNAQIGPTLANVKTVVENSNKQIMSETGVDSLNNLAAIDGYGAGTPEAYSAYLVRCVPGSSLITDTENYGIYSQVVDYNSQIAQGAAPVLSTYGPYFKFSASIDMLFFRYADVSLYNSKGSFKGAFCFVYVDINTFRQGPNAFGRDVFEFILDKSGSMIPFGGSVYAHVFNQESPIWETDCNENTVTNGQGCTGSIFDNNLKVIYQ